tara:strand:- start:10490 stop:10807 length:318 start_codon:yes stop_codon:yes gene_type:complete
MNQEESKDNLISNKEHTIFNASENNHFLTTKELNLDNLRVYLNLKFTSLRIAGQKAGLSYSRIKQLVTGKYLPSKPILIKQLSESWDIDPIKLTQLFERMREKNE